MALNKGSKSLRDLMAARNKAPTPKETSKPQLPPTLPLPPSIPTYLGLKNIPDPKKNRSLKEQEEGEVGPQKGSKQQKVAKDPHDKRSTSVDSREEENRVEVHDARNKANIEALSHAEAKKSIGAPKQEQEKLSEKLKEAVQARNSVEVGLKTAKR
nr:uncharacterized protein LOC112017127 [Quercus suber]